MTKLKLIKDIEEVNFYGNAEAVFKKAEETGKVEILSKYLGDIFSEPTDFHEINKYIGCNMFFIETDIELDDDSYQSIQKLWRRYNKCNNVQVLVNFNEYDPIGQAEFVFNKICRAGKETELEEILAEAFPDGATEYEVNEYICFNVLELFDKFKIDEDY